MCHPQKLTLNMGYLKGSRKEKERQESLSLPFSSRNRLASSVEALSSSGYADP